MVRDYPGIEIVISSTWRCDFSLEKLKGYFAQDIQERIVGVTPIIESALPFNKRECEILLWLEQNGRSEDDWIAVDDAGWQFKTHKRHLVECVWYDGFNARAEAKLRERLSS